MKVKQRRTHCHAPHIPIQHVCLETQRLAPPPTASVKVQRLHFTNPLQNAVSHQEGMWQLSATCTHLKCGQLCLGGESGRQRPLLSCPEDLAFIRGEEERQTQAKAQPSPKKDSPVTAQHDDSCHPYKTAKKESHSEAAGLNLSSGGISADSPSDWRHFVRLIARRPRFYSRLRSTFWMPDIM